MCTATKDIFFMIVSALIYGLTPILAKIAYDGGSNGVSMTFLRAVRSLPVIVVIMRVMRIPFVLARAQARDLLLALWSGNTTAIVLLYASYPYIHVGMATIPHFIYPVIVGIASEPDGAITASILSTFEPITSVVLAVLILGETLSPAKAVRVLCIIVSVLVITMAMVKGTSRLIESERLTA